MWEGAVDLTQSDDDAGAAVKQDVKPEADEAGLEGAYDCLMCFNSCRRQPALHCTACTCNPWHVSCAAGTQFARLCPQCARASVAPWTRGRFTTLQHNEECVDLVAEEEAAEERQREREREESRKRELEERQRELEREEQRKRELERAREEEKERARAREDATRREQERARGEEVTNRQRDEEREEEEKKRSRARERGRVDRSALVRWSKAKWKEAAVADCDNADEEESSEHSRSTKYEDEFVAVLRQSAADWKQQTLLLLQRKTQEEQQQQQQPPHLPAFAGAKGKVKVRPPLPPAPEACGSACPPLSSYLKPAARTAMADCTRPSSDAPPQAKPARHVANLAGDSGVARAREPAVPLPFSALLAPSAGPGRSAGAGGYVDMHGAHVQNGASPMKSDPGRRRGDIARIKKLSRDKLHKSVMR